MSKSEKYFVCNECGEEYTKWQGVCDSCKAWNTLKEFKVDNRPGATSKVKAEALEVQNIIGSPKSTLVRIPSGNFELDRVLGGGIVPGSVVLLGGDPGVGKSTMLLTIALSIPKTLYISGEESGEQIGLRLHRVDKTKELKFLGVTDVNAVIATAGKMMPTLLIIDSIQTMYDSSFPSTPGSIVQVRESALKLQQFAKKTSTAVILVGHVTKGGAIAGPKILEHMVDVVLGLEGDRRHDVRILSAQKNRFGGTREVGVLQMTSVGLEPVANPSELFLKGRMAAPGSVVTSTLEGSRPLLIEIQALTSSSYLASPKRTSNGFSRKRLDLIAAVLTRRAGLALGRSDIFVNVVGGCAVKEPAADLAVALAIASSHRGVTLDPSIAVVGEVGLSGEIRQVKDMDLRKKEAKRLGFEIVANPKTVRQLVEDLCPKKK